MVLKVLGSGSSGNCYILESDNEALIIEAGVPLKEVKIALGFNIRKIVGVVVTHSHMDHAKYISEYEKAGIKTFKPYEFSNHMSAECNYMGCFRIKDFALTDKEGVFKHTNSDGSECPCYGFYITHKDIGSMVYISDTELVKWNFRKHNINHILVEANYSDDLVERDAVNREHVLRGHMSLKTALDFIFTNDNPALRNVVLIHLSDKNADSADFLQKIKETVKYGTDCYIAEKGLEVDLNLCPF